MDLGAHVFDLVRFLLGEFSEVQARLETFIPQRPDPKTGAMSLVDVDDLAIVQARMASGAIGVIEASRLATGTQDDLRLEIHGSRGAIAFHLINQTGCLCTTTPILKRPWAARAAFRRLSASPATQIPMPSARPRTPLAGRSSMSTACLIS